MTPPEQVISPPPKAARRARCTNALAWLGLISVCLAHGWAVLAGMGGWDGLLADRPLFRHDHPLYLHSAVVTRSFLRESWTTAGYDPTFMSGYAKSVVFPASSTLPELVLALAPGARPFVAYKLYVFVSVALIPWIVAGACLMWRLGPWTCLVATALFLVYVWSDYPINYASLGMVPYLLGIPVGLLATASIGRFLDRVGLGRWGAMSALCSLAVMIHLTTAMIVLPAAVVLYLADVRRRVASGTRRPGWADAGILAVPVVVLLLNSFWWYPGIPLASTKGPSDFAFAHPEPVIGRLAKILGHEPRVEAILIPLAAWGLVVLARRDRTAAIALGAFLAAGFAWGYLAGASRALDFLQPGRHTFAFYAAASVAGAVGIAGLLARVGTRSRGGATVLGGIGLVTLVAWLGPELRGSVIHRTNARDPFLSSRPTRRYQAIRRLFDTRLRPGDRLLYEEGGFGIPGVPDPFAGGRFSGLLPMGRGVELLGGPYLHASLQTNFTQFGEDKLFERRGWDRDFFVRHAKLYRPTAILCWTPHARRFCRENPDLVDVSSDDGTILFGRVLGFGGDTIRGEATVEARPGRLRVRLAPSAVDGLAVLRYHFVPRLRAEPAVRVTPVFLEDDPVPFIGLPSSVDGSTVDLVLRP